MTGQCLSFHRRMIKDMTIRNLSRRNSSRQPTSVVARRAAKLAPEELRRRQLSALVAWVLAG